MAAPTLTLLNSTSISTAESTTGWTTFDTLDSDIKKEGSNGITGTFRNDGANGNYSAGSAPVTAVGKTFRMWINTTNVAYIDTETNGGYELWIYDGTTSEYKTFFSSDDYYGGWFQVVYDMDAFTTLTLANVEQWGIRCQHTIAAKNVDNIWVDALKYLDGYSMTGGTSGDEITLTTIEVADRGTTTLYGYGVLTEFGGVYYCSGEMQFGTGSTTTWVLMDGEILIFDDKPVAAGLYALSGVGTGTRATIKNSVIRAAGTTDSTRFAMDWSDADLLSLTLTDNLIVRSSTSVFKSGQTATGNTFDDCGQITPNGADMTGSAVKNYEGTADTGAVSWTPATDPDGLLDDMTFTKGTAATHAIEFGTASPLTMTLTGIDFSGYTNTIASTSAPLLIKRTSGTVTINLSGCSGITADGYKSAGATVNIVDDPVTVSATAQTAAGTKIEDARVFVKATGTGPFPVEDTVTIVNSGTTATVTHATHGMATGDKVEIEDASLAANNGVFEITVTGASAYTYTMGSTPGSSPTGTILSTFVFLKGLTSALGVISMSRVMTADQPATGWARKSSGTPYYKQGPISGTVTSDGGASFVAILSPDE